MNGGFHCRSTHPTLAEELVKKGQQLARKGEIEKATAQFQEAREIAPQLTSYVNLEEMTVNKVAAVLRVNEGKELMVKGDMDAAFIKFKEALKLEPKLQVTEIEELAKLLMAEGDELARAGDIETAIVRFREARILTPQLNDVNLERLAAQWLDQEEKERKEWWDTFKQITKGLGAVGTVAALLILL